MPKGIRICIALICAVILIVGGAALFAMGLDLRGRMSRLENHCLVDIPIDLSKPRNISKTFYHTNSWAIGFCLKVVVPKISGGHRSPEDLLGGIKGLFSIKDPNGSEMITKAYDRIIPSDHYFVRPRQNELIIGVTNPDLLFPPGEYTLGLMIEEGTARLSETEQHLVLSCYRYGPEYSSATLLMVAGILGLILSGIVLSCGLRISTLIENLLRKSEHEDSNRPR